LYHVLGRIIYTHSGLSGVPGNQCDYVYSIHFAAMSNMYMTVTE